jgi:methionine-R-sulfoxide reductase
MLQTLKQITILGGTLLFLISVAGAFDATAKWMTFAKPSKEELKKRLTPMQYDVTQEKGTEPPFKNEYADNKKEGIYVDIVSGEPLFSSVDKFDSGTGWPSFTKPLEPANIVEKDDWSFFTHRKEVRCRFASRACFQRRASAHTYAFLHELGSAAFHTKGESCERGLRRISEAFWKIT